MVTRVVLAPAALGKTHWCIQRVYSVLKETLLAPVWVVVPNSNQVLAFRRGLAQAGGALGARIGTFGHLYANLIAAAGQSIPVMPDALNHRLALDAIDAVAARGQLKHYGEIRRRPGFIRGFLYLVAELKRGRITPDSFRVAVAGMGDRLTELALLYEELQSRLLALGWADTEGLGWLAVQALAENAELAQGYKLVVVDGFDSFTHTQIRALELLGRRVDELVITLSGDPAMQRKAFRRFGRTLDRLKAELPVQVQELDKPHRNPLKPLDHLQTGLFESRTEPTGPEQNVSFVQAQTQELEAREALRWCKAHLKRGRDIRPDQCAVLAYNLDAYRPFLRQIGREFGLPLRFCDGEPLIGNPAVAAILNVLELASQNWARRPLLDALRTPYFELTRFGIAPTDPARYMLVAEWGQVIAGLDQWRQVFTRLEQQATPASTEKAQELDTNRPELPAGVTARALWAHLEEFCNRATPPVQGSLFALVEWLEDLLAAETGLALAEQIAAQNDTARRDQVALAEFREILRSLVLSEHIAGTRAEMAWAEFFQELRGAVQAATYVKDDLAPTSEGAIFVAPVGQARGVPYRVVALLGLAEGLFPAPLDEDPFLSDEERTTLHAKGVALEPRLRSDQQTIFYEAVTRATEYLLLTRPYMADDGEEWQPSPYWKEACALFDVEPTRIRAQDTRHHTQAGSVVELLTDAVRRRALPKAYAQFTDEWRGLQFAATVLKARVAREPAGPFEGQLNVLADTLATRYSDGHVWSASRLESYAGCPFRFFIGAALDLEPRETPAAGFDASQLGSMLHAILEEVYRQAPDPNDGAGLVATLPGIAQAVFRTAPEIYGFRPTALWQAQQAELAAKLENTLSQLADESSRAGFTPRRYEESFGFHGQPPLAVETDAGRARLHGVIDRVDVNDRGEVRIIDYKTGSSHLDAGALKDGSRLQLVLYALGAEKALKLGKIVDGFYWKILKGEAGSLHLQKFDHTTEDGRTFKGVPGAVALAKEYLAQYVSGIRAGKFVPVPPRGTCPSYCDARTICWRYTPSDY